MKEKILLGFSGGLDTSFCAKYLADELNYEVHTLLVNTGGFDEIEINKIENRAKELGIVNHTTIDTTEDYYQRVIKHLIFGNVLKNNTYPLSVSAERLSQAITIVKYAKQKNITHIAHGSTGAGNDQVRFDMIIHTLYPEAKIITPIRDFKLSREEEVNYLKRKGILIPVNKAIYSVNKGLWGTSVGGKETLTSKDNLPDSAFPTPVTKTNPLDITLAFYKGELIEINNKKYTSSVDAIKDLQSIAQPFGIGRDIHVGDTIIGIKGRVGFEAAAPMIIIKAHHTLEKHVLTKWQLMWKDQLANFYGNYLHEGQILDPVMRNIESFFIDSQKNVTGKVFITLYPYRFQINGIESEFDLLNNKFGTYGEMNNSWTGDDVKGFTKIYGNAVGIYNAVNNINNEN